MDERSSIRPAALGIMCKAPRPGTTKTRLAAVVGSEQAASMAACFLRDVATGVEAVPQDIGRCCYGVYAPQSTEAALEAILPASFGLLLRRIPISAWCSHPQPSSCSKLGTAAWS